MYWNGLPYHSLDYELKRLYGCKIYKLSLDGGMTCPNRDGTLGKSGCLFCSAGGSGDFAEPCSAGVTAQLNAAKARVAQKMPKGGTGRYIAYFQSYTNTYASLPYLRALFTEAILHPDVVILSIATRPDCLSEEIIGLLSELNRIKPVWVELGLQTIHEPTAMLIRRGYSLNTFESAWRALKGQGLTVIAHTIAGLPGETKEMMLDTVRYLGSLGCGTGIDGIKLQLLHILMGTDLAAMYEAQPFPLFTLDGYADFIVDAIALLPPGTVIHRISGDGPKKQLIEPQWSADKRRVLNTIAKRFRERGVTQGDLFMYNREPENH